MKRFPYLMLLLVFIALPCFAGTTITYTYDRQHRLTQVSYSESEKVFYSYDRANNLDLEVSITDSKYLKLVSRGQSLAGTVNNLERMRSFYLTHRKSPTSGKLGFFRARPWTGRGLRDGDG